MIRALLLTALLGLAGCAGSPPPATVGRVDLPRYQGTWYEQARLPMFFQRHCVESEAHYHLRDDGSLAVLNRCRTASGDWQQAEGRAEAQAPGVTDRLWVRFDNWLGNLFPDLIRGDYWVFYLDPDYQLALVGNPSREYLWLLSRRPQLDPLQRERLLVEARARGFDTSALIWRGRLE